MASRAVPGEALRGGRIVSRRRRGLAAGVDLLVAVILGLLTSSTLGHWAAARAAVLLHVGEPDSFWRGPLPLLLGAIGNLSYSLPLVVLLVVLPEAAVGIGPGKALTGLSIQPAHPSLSTPLTRRFLLKCAPCLAWILALSWARPWTLAVFVTSLFLSTVGCLPLLRRGDALHDRLAQTWVEAKPSQRM